MKAKSSAGISLSPLKDTVIQATRTALSFAFTTFFRSPLFTLSMSNHKANFKRKEELKIASNKSVYIMNELLIFLILLAKLSKILNKLKHKNTVYIYYEIPIMIISKPSIPRLSTI